MLNLTDKQILEIAENLESGMRVYYNLKTGEMKSIINFDTWVGGDEELWREELNEINEHSNDYLEFEGFSSNQSFQIMVDFAESINEPHLMNKLFKALDRPKPFQNFKWEIDNSVEYRQMWFDFKRIRFIERVKEQIEMYNLRLDEQYCYGKESKTTRIITNEYLVMSLQIGMLAVFEVLKRF